MYRGLVFNGTIPQLKNIKYTDWVQKKHLFRDEYYECPDSTIARLYSAKGCDYIQISGKGLYHLGTDSALFGVPLFSCKQKFRVRIKVHGRFNSKGFATLSPILSCIPCNIKNLEPSPYSLDDMNKIPPQLVLYDSCRHDDNL